MNKRLHIPDDLEQMAIDGWLQMKEKLPHTTLSPVEPLARDEHKRWPWLLIAASTIGFLVFVSPFYIKQYDTSKSVQLTSEANRQPVQQAPVNDNPIATINPLHSKHVIQVAAVTGQVDLDSIAYAIITKKRTTKIATDYLMVRPPQVLDSIELKMESFTPGKQIVTAKKTLPKPQLYVGGAINLANPGIDKNVWNLHPSARFILPLNDKWSIQAGLYAMSSLHSKKVKVRERDMINNLPANLMYEINTTSVIKARYFELPLTVNYHLSPKWQVGAGISLSYLHKADVIAQNERYDFSNSLINTTTVRYNGNQFSPAAAYRQKISIKKTEPRLVIEAGYHCGPVLFTAGYHYAVQKGVVLEQAAGQTSSFRNQYLKLGVQINPGLLRK